MPTQGSISPSVISSVLLAVRRMAPTSPWQILHHLNGPKSLPEYNFLDAFATLCTFVPQCDFASAAIQQGAQLNCLYIATSPSASPTLRKLINAMISALPAASLGPSSMNHPDASHRFIVEVYRSVHGKFFDAVQTEECNWLLDDLSDMSPVERLLHNISIEEYTSLVDAIRFLMASKDKDGSTFVDTDFFGLHHVAQKIGKFKDALSAHALVLHVDSISRAVDTIVKWATFSDGKEQWSINLPIDVVFVDLLSAPDFLATTNPDEISGCIDKKLYDSASRAWNRFEPSGGVSEVKGSPDHFIGHGTVHCESALLHYILDKHIPVDPYIGCSHPTCYACFMLVRVCAWATGKPFSVGCQSTDLENLDVAWSYPPMGTDIYKKLERDILADFRKLCLNANANDHRHPVSIVNDISDLPTLSQYLGSFEVRGV